MLLMRALLTRLLRLGSYFEELEALGALAQAGLRKTNLNRRNPL